MGAVKQGILFMFWNRKKRGANAIEFALTLPVFLVLFMGGMDWGWYFFMVLVLLPIPIVLTSKKSGFETRRWYNSDYG